MKSLGIIILFITINANFVCAQIDNNSWLNDNAFNIESIDPENENFDDLEFLIPLLKDKQIVMLGEESHSFATTFEAKSRLIKFLHQKLGFTILAFEFDMYAMWKINKLESNPPEQLLPIQKSIYPFWGLTTSTQELFRYIENTKSTESQLNYIGFDGQIVPIFDFFEDLMKMLEKHNSEVLDYKNFELFSSVFQDNYYQQMQNLSLENYALLSMFIDDILYVPWRISKKKCTIKSLISPLVYIKWAI